MAIDFPSSPTNGQIYQGYYWDNAKQAWRSNNPATGSVIMSATTPVGATSGDMWFNTADGTMFVYYNDGISSNWIEIQANVDNYKTPSYNYIINGAFEINQRGFVSNTTGAYGFDRWAGSATSGTYSAQTFAPGTGPIPEATGGNFARIVTSAHSVAGDYANYGQPIEDVRTLAGKTITVSFYAKVASGTPKIGIELNQWFGTSTGETNTPFGAVTLLGGATWTRYSITGIVPNVSGKTIANANNFLKLIMWVSSGSTYATRASSIGLQNNTFDIWGAQVEEGSVATPFRRNAPSIQAELAACQRYFVAFPANSIEIINPYFSVALNSGPQRIPVNFPVPMLKTPSITTNSGTTLHVFTYYPSNAGSNRTANITVNGRNNVSMSASYDSGNNGAGTLAAVYATGDNNNPIWVSAEL